jgi:hypothetical protein
MFLIFIIFSAMSDFEIKMEQKLSGEVSGTCLLMDRDKTSNLYREPSIDASYQVSVHLAKWFQRRRFKKISQSETRIACGGHVCKWIGTI